MSALITGEFQIRFLQLRCTDYQRNGEALSIHMNNLLRCAAEKKMTWNHHLASLSAVDNPLLIYSTSMETSGFQLTNSSEKQTAEDAETQVECEL